MAACDDIQGKAKLVADTGTELAAYAALFISAFTLATLLPGSSEVALLTLLAMVRDDPQANLPLLQRLAAWVEQGRLHPQATTVHPMEDAPSLLQALLERRSVGKPVIKIVAPDRA